MRLVCWNTLTHRDYAQSVRFLTHLKDEKLDIDWKNLNKKQRHLSFIWGYCRYQNQRAYETRNAVQYADRSYRARTTYNQRVVSSTLDKISLEVLELELKSPTTFIVGEVVKLRGQLNWYG